MRIVIKRLISSNGILLLLCVLCCKNPAKTVVNSALQQREFPKNSRSNVTRISRRINEIPRLPMWNEDGQKHIDFTQLFELMGEPRGSRGKELSQLISRPRPKCNRRIRIQNGVTRIKERGSLARFMCSHGFTLIGPMTLVCLRDQWSEDPPICVRSGCRSPKVPVNGDMRQSIGGALAAFYCNINSELIGNPVLFCDGNRWNGTEPVCFSEEVSTTQMLTSITLTEKAQIELWDTSVQVQPDTTTNSYSSSSETIISNKHGFFEPENTTSSFFSGETSLFSTTSLILEDKRPGSVSNFHTFTTAGLINHDSHFQQNAETSTNHVVIITSDKSVSLMDIITTTPFTSKNSMGEDETVTNYTYTTISSSSSSLTAVDKNSSTKSISNYIFNSLSTQSPRNESLVKLVNVTLAHVELNIATQTPLRENLLSSTTKRIDVPIFPPRKRPRPQRPLYTKKPVKRPLRKRTTTTRLKPQSHWVPSIRPFQTTPTVVATSKTITPSSFLVPGISRQASSDYVIAIDKEFPSKEHVESIHPIEPDMLNILNKHASKFDNNSGNKAHPSIIGGIILFVIGLSTFAVGIVLYCWRKNMGIARARPNDLDGRTLSLHDADASEDFAWYHSQSSAL